MHPPCQSDVIDSSPPPSRLRAPRQTTHLSTRWGRLVGPVTLPTFPLAPHSNGNAAVGGSPRTLRIWPFQA